MTIKRNMPLQFGDSKTADTKLRRQHKMIDSYNSQRPKTPAQREYAKKLVAQDKTPNYHYGKIEETMTAIREAGRARSRKK